MSVRSDRIGVLARGIACLCLGAVLAMGPFASSAAAERPAGRVLKASLRDKALSPPSDVGRPVNVNTGNAWLSQTDAVIPGIGAPLVLSRDYNSGNAADPRASMGFGRGWTHRYGQTLTPAPTAGVLQLMQGSGVAAYYE